MQTACPVPSSSTALIVADVCLRERSGGDSFFLLLRRFRHFQDERFSSSYGQSTGVYFLGSTQRRFKVKKKTYTQQDQNERRRQVLLACLPCKKTWTCSARTFFFSLKKKKQKQKNTTFSIPHSPRTGYWINKRERERRGDSLYIFERKRKRKNIYIIICKSDANDDGGAPPKWFFNHSRPVLWLPSTRALTW